tara:strand:+ start:521 stop:835 length:315 start_codon:yes stop_codon:yes gene_type:complete
MTTCDGHGSEAGLSVLRQRGGLHRCGRGVRNGAERLGQELAGHARGGTHRHVLLGRALPGKGEVGLGVVDADHPGLELAVDLLDLNHGISVRLALNIRLAKNDG